MDNEGLKPRNIVKESNSWARAYLDIPTTNIWSERIIGQLQAYIQKGDTEFRDSIFMAGELEENQRKKLGGKQLADIDKAAKQITRANIFIWHGRHNWECYPLFEYLKFEDGLILGKFNHAVRPFLLGENGEGIKTQFALRSIPEFKQLRSVYAQTLYTHLNSYTDIGYCDILVSELHKILHTWDKPSYMDYKAFNRRVLQPAIDEINLKSNKMPYIIMRIKDYEKTKKAKGTRGRAKTIRFNFMLRTTEMVLAQLQKDTKKMAQLAKQRLRKSAPKQEEPAQDAEFKKIGDCI